MSRFKPCTVLYIIILCTTAPKRVETMKIVLFSYSTVCAESKRKFVHRFMFIWHLKIEFFGFIFIFIALSHRIIQQSQRAIVQILCSSQQSYTDKNQFAQFINCSSAIIRWRQRQRQVWRFALALITAFVMIRRYTHTNRQQAHTHTLNWNQSLSLSLFMH